MTAQAMQGTQPRVQIAGPEFAQWDALLGLIQASFAYMQGRINPPSSALGLDAAALAARAKTETLIVAQAQNGTLLGCAFCARQQDALYIGKLAVSIGHQGQGLGQQLLTAAADLARQQGLGLLRLQTRVELVENQRAFAAMGFVETARSAHAGFAQPTSITMEKHLVATTP